jgi:hypothetical protein
MRGWFDSTLAMDWIGVVGYRFPSFKFILGITLFRNRRIVLIVMIIMRNDSVDIY